MRSSSEMSNETNFMAQYMSSVSRAGVILNYQNLEPEGDFQLLKSASSLPIGHFPEHFANSASFVSEDSIEEELSSSKEDEPLVANTSDQMTAFHLATRGSILNYKDPVVEWEDNKMSQFLREDNVLREDFDDPLLKKLEQLKEMQQQKQEQLKRQQMEQLQKLMEEQKMLLNMVSRHSTYSGVDENPTFGWSNSSQTPANNLYLKSMVNQNIPTEYLHGHGHFSIPSYQDEQNVPEKYMGNPEQSPFVIGRPTASVQESYQDSAVLQDYLENKEDSPSFDGENYDNNSREDVSHNDDFVKSVRDEVNCSLQSGNHVQTGSAEDRPIVAAIKERKKSFEEFLEEQMVLEEKRLGQNNQQQCNNEQTVCQPIMKRPFLRRGEGLARFKKGNRKLTIPKENKSIPQTRVHEVIIAAKVEKPQIQRKTALLGKEQNCENDPGIIKKSTQDGKDKTEPIRSVQKKQVLKNCNVKNSRSPARGQLDNKSDGNVKSSLQGEKNKIIETNKENMEIAMITEANRLDNKVKSRGNQNAPARSNINSGANGRQTETLFEASFQKRQVNWEKETQKENFELDEFLLLEQAAEDLSFSSNSSFVQKLLDQNYQIDNSHNRLSSTPVKMAQKAKGVGNVDHINREEHHEIQTKTATVNTLEIISDVPSDKCDKKYGKGNEETLQSNIREGKKIKPSHQVTSEDCVTSEDEHNVTITSENEDLGTIICNKEDYAIYEDCKKPSKNLNMGTKNRDFDLDLSDGEGYNNESTLVEGKENILEDNDSSSSSDSSQVEFDDEQTWTDLEEVGNQQELSKKDGVIKEFIPSDYTSRSPDSNSDMTLKRKVATKKMEDQPKMSVTVGKQSPPPASDLMMKLFPALKPKPETQLPRKSLPVQEDAADIRSQLLQQKLVELETEIERFKIENATLARLREDQEKNMANLKKDVADFEQQKAKELARIEELKKEEMKKLQKERKVFEKYASAARAIPDKKEREEIQSLKQQVTDLQEEMKRKEAKWSNNHCRLKNQIETLAKENAELREEIKFMEKVRLESWKKAEAAESNMKITEGQGPQLRRSESVSPPSLSKKSINPCPAPQAEKSSIIRRSQSPPAKGKASRISKKASACDPNNSQRAKVNQAESTGNALPAPEQSILPVEQKTQINLIKGSSDEVQGEISYPDGKVERILRNGCHVILFPNGTRKEVSADGKSTSVTFFNGDVKQVMADQRVIYYYADAQTTHTTYPDGLEILQFSSGQIEKHFPDGKKEITFPDQTIKNLYSDGREESIFPDGTIITVQLDGSKLIEFDNGQRELHTAQFKRREYPDGTVKTVYSNGQQETKYASGRVRVKDKDGNIIMDTKI
ncbi:centrosomal P4.1-associated protein [Discoglossus pictus]